MTQENLQQDNAPAQPYEKLSRQEIKGIIEALLFSSQRPLSAKELKEIAEVDDIKIINELVEEIKSDCVKDSRSFKVVEIAGGYQLNTDPVYAKWLRKLYKIKQSDYLTRPSLETLSVIAYKQPVTKAEIEFIRGVNVDGVIKNLMQKNLIRISGKKKVIGSPYLYSTTRLFLQYFGLNSLEDLPKLPEFKEADIQLELQQQLLVENNPEQEETAGQQQNKNEVIKDETPQHTQENR
ncbi:MAG: SMC-Scp complex subunit ScpB [Candidatus Omnitrophica bacterium]|nr:SMC-Scp complex subunit ScpB [Candidatus Omnitrophota bacterium]